MPREAIDRRAVPQPAASIVELGEQRGSIAAMPEIISPARIVLSRAASRRQSSRRIEP
jgi:hypothetical protein